MVLLRRAPALFNSLSISPSRSPLLASSRSLLTSRRSCHAHLFFPEAELQPARRRRHLLHLPLLLLARRHRHLARLRHLTHRAVALFGPAAPWIGLGSDSPRDGLRAVLLPSSRLRRPSTARRPPTVSRRPFVRDTCCERVRAALSSSSAGTASYRAARRWSSACGASSFWSRSGTSA